MSKFNEASYFGKVAYLINVFKENWDTHIKIKMPGQYSLGNLIHMERGFNSMEQTMGGGTNIIALLYFKRGESVLDVGCGSACHLKYFDGLDYYGMDLSESAIALAMLKYPTSTFFNLSIYNAVEILQPALFDNVYCCSLLEHIGNWEMATTNMLKLAKKKVVVGFFDGLSPMNSNYYEFHPFTVKGLIEFKIVPDYGYKPVISPQESNIEANVFQQPGNYRVRLGVASLVSAVPAQEIVSSRLFDYDLISKTVSMRLLLYYSQNHASGFEKYVSKLPGYIGKRIVQEGEIGYFMNRYSKDEFMSYLKRHGLKFEVIDYERNDGKFASFVVIDK